MRGNASNITPHTPLQKRIGEISRELERKGGQNVMTTLARFFQHSPPVTEFPSTREYLEYRYEDFAMPYVSEAWK